VSSRIRIGVISAGAIGAVHMEAFNKLEDTTVTAVSDTYLPLAEKRAKEFGISNVFSSPEELIHHNEVDAVVIGVPNKFHAPLAIEALRAGKHVLVEKPMGINGEAAKEIVRVQRETGRLSWSRTKCAGSRISLN
jgi:predicted dehydrogenase